MKRRDKAKQKSEVQQEKTEVKPAGRVTRSKKYVENKVVPTKTEGEQVGGSNRVKIDISMGRQNNQKAPCTIKGQINQSQIIPQEQANRIDAQVSQNSSLSVDDKCASKIFSEGNSTITPFKLQQIQDEKLQEAKEMQKEDSKQVRSFLGIAQSSKCEKGQESGSQKDFEGQIQTSFDYVIPPFKVTKQNDQSEKYEKPKSQRGRGAKRMETQFNHNKPGQVVQNSRMDNSLGELTRKFIEMIQSEPDQTVDLNKVATKLDVQKRRIYDITNVLEGIGLVEKTFKNQIKWCGMPGAYKAVLSDQEQLERHLAADQSLRELRMEEVELDGMIEAIQEELTQIASEPAYQEFGYLTHADISQLSTNVIDSQMQPNRSDTPIIAIKAPKGSKVKIAARDVLAENLRPHYQITIQSSTKLQNEVNKQDLIPIEANLIVGNPDAYQGSEAGEESLLMMFPG
ncbi:hypothetical protein FGO68_gene3153 [Halteria grandinella]|uniref:E2F/DP family winged-helix DNA-binding domain-containing protein n=1 Tax=Halteria grandinella TaxID=5974 RepID=A0A8J8P374_HALGN|nr:hypothetical protein FGO68_gene3153 [Halteria grandinella]